MLGNWIIVGLLLACLLVALIGICYHIRNRIELRTLRRHSRNQTSTIYRVNNLARRIHTTLLLQELEQQFASQQEELEEQEPPESPSGQWPSVQTL